MGRAQEPWGASETGALEAGSLGAAGSWGQGFVSSERPSLVAPLSGAAAGPGSGGLVPLLGSEESAWGPSVCDAGLECWGAGGASCSAVRHGLLSHAGWASAAPALARPPTMIANPTRMHQE